MLQDLLWDVELAFNVAKSRSKRTAPPPTRWFRNVNGMVLSLAFLGHSVRKGELIRTSWGHGKPVGIRHGPATVFGQDLSQSHWVLDTWEGDRDQGRKSGNLPER